MQLLVMFGVELRKVRAMNTNNLFPGEENDKVFRKADEDMKPVVQDNDEEPYENEDVKEQAQKDKLSGPGIDLVDQPDGDNHNDD